MKYRLLYRDDASNSEPEVLHDDIDREDALDLLDDFTDPSVAGVYYLVKVKSSNG